MTLYRSRSDVACRAAGMGLMVASAAASLIGAFGTIASLGWFLVCVAGLVLVVNGQHVLTVFRAERRGHARTAGAIHATRVRRAADRRMREFD